MLAGARVYVFSSSGTYLSRSAATDSAGATSLTLPVNTYKLRIDYDGGKYWTEEIELIQGQAVDAAYDLDTLALNLTANPHYARYDGEMPQKEAPPVLLASIGSLVGYGETPSQPETVYYINDHLVVWDGTYLPFGMVKDSVGGAQNLLRFPGQYFDGETGLHYNWHRYYDPMTGRYLTPDPIGLTGGINPFVYVQNDPVNLLDPLGLWTFQVGVSFTAGGLFGSTKGGGIIFGRNPQTKEFQFGWYIIGGSGALGGATASATFDFTYSDNPCIDDVSGWAGTAGGSGSVGIFSFGGETNTPISLKDNSHTFSIGVGTPGVEGHGFATYTHVERLQ